MWYIGDQWPYYWKVETGNTLYTLVSLYTVGKSINLRYPSNCHFTVDSNHNTKYKCHCQPANLCLSLCFLVLSFSLYPLGPLILIITIHRWVSEHFLRSNGISITRWKERSWSELHHKVLGSTIWIRIFVLTNHMYLIRNNLIRAE